MVKMISCQWLLTFSRACIWMISTLCVPIWNHGFHVFGEDSVRSLSKVFSANEVK